MNYLVYMIFRGLALAMLFVPFILAFGQMPPEYSVMENPSYYDLTIDENSFSIAYEVNADVIAMDIDGESSSLLIGLIHAKDSVFKIDLPTKLINDSNNDFTVLVDGYEIDYEIVTDGDSSTFSFFVPEFSEEIEIIGTHVIPEFPIGAIAGFIGLMVAMVIFSKSKIINFKW